MRVYVPTTPARLAGLRQDGLPAGTEAYAATTELAEALGLPGPAASGADGTSRDRDGAGETDEAAEDLAETARQAAAEASLLLLAEDGTTPARRTVLVAEARARAVGGDAHPGAVVLTAPLRWGAVESVLADDPSASARVTRAVALVEDDQDAAVARLERDVLGWFHPDEAGLTEVDGPAG